MQQLKIDQIIRLKIKRLGINGEGIGYYKQFIVFVPNALPKEEVDVRIVVITPKFAEGIIKKIHKNSPERITPDCPVYETCGGCQLQHLSYEAQLIFKRDLLKQALAKFKPENYSNYPLRKTLGMKNPWNYRNKAQFQLAQTNNKIYSGLYQAGSHQIVAIDNCPVQQTVINDIIQKIIKILNNYNLPIYNEQKNSGIFKTLMVRNSIQTGKVQVVFITQSKKFPNKLAIIQEIIQKCPEVISIMQNIQNEKTSVVMGEETIHLWGEHQIEEKINQVTFRLSSRAFFQLNPKQTEILYGEAIKALDSLPSDKIIDAYCGVGTIGLSIARKVKEVRGMDTIPQAIEDAKQNAKKVNATNTYYEVGNAEKLLPKWLEQGFIPDGIIVDPPRVGLDKKLLQTILNFPPKKLVYISCNVSTLARDLVSLTKVFKVDYLQSIDMFPQTARCEVVAKLTRKK
ncbi:TrmA family RNA methyltransferase [Melissococcus plutonius DAT561]|uniref:RNA methyltransferase, TrmA family n=1 Tax=Melissococcus plutonius TaxID=33970 RepID=A0A2Z5Y111_9ENTE|nr:TrmA family RNA methyltransferase [Melissococcus plutonius DAT561]BBC60464.1 RNA methyltransferase, TrmA family [Melissococcus plutonius]